VNPSTRIRFGLRVALRRRKGWAALLQLRRALRSAIAEHVRRTLDPRDHAYAGDVEQLKMRSQYNRAIRRLLARWPRLSLTDERGEP
jgi:hypothetical protein